MNATNQPILPSLRRFALYAKAVEFAGLALAVPVQGSLRNQLHRATESVVLNVAEGAGSLSPAAKAHYWSIARASLC